MNVVRKLALPGASVIFSAAVAPVFAAAGWGNSAPALIETVPPVAGVLAVPASSASAPVALSFAGASDAGTGLLRVELWYRTDATAWAYAGVMQNSAAGALPFTPPGASPANYGNYHFELVAVDVAGNTSIIPSGVSGTGQGTTVFGPAASMADWWVLE